MHRKFYKTIIQVEVLSEGPYEFKSLKGLVYDIDQGDCSGVSGVKSSKALPRKKFVEAVQEQDSDPDFFQLDDNGKDLD